MGETKEVFFDKVDIAKLAELERMGKFRVLAVDKPNSFAVVAKVNVYRVGDYWRLSKYSGRQITLGLGKALELSRFQSQCWHMFRELGLVRVCSECGQKFIGNYQQSKLCYECSKQRSKLRDLETSLNIEKRNLEFEREMIEFEREQLSSVSSASASSASASSASASSASASASSASASSASALIEVVLTIALYLSLIVWLVIWLRGEPFCVTWWTWLIGYLMISVIFSALCIKFRIGKFE